MNGPSQLGPRGMLIGGRTSSSSSHVSVSAVAHSTSRPHSIDLTRDEEHCKPIERSSSGKRATTADEDISGADSKRRKTLEGLDVLNGDAAKLPPSPIKEHESMLLKDASESTAAPGPTKHVYEGSYKEEQPKMVVSMDSQTDCGRPGATLEGEGPGPVMATAAGAPTPAATLDGASGTSGATGASASGTNAGGDRHLCVICQDADRQLLFHPCSHICTCAECGNNNLDKCPICRQEITRKISIYLS